MESTKLKSPSPIDDIIENQSELWATRYSEIYSESKQKVTWKNSCLWKQVLWKALNVSANLKSKFCTNRLFSTKLSNWESQLFDYYLERIEKPISSYKKTQEIGNVPMVTYSPDLYLIFLKTWNLKRMKVLISRRFFIDSQIWQPIKSQRFPQNHLLLVKYKVNKLFSGLLNWGLVTSSDETVDKALIRTNETVKTHVWHSSWTEKKTGSDIHPWNLYEASRNP